MWQCTLLPNWLKAEDDTCRKTKSSVASAGFSQPHAGSRGSIPTGHLHGVDQVAADPQEPAPPLDLAKCGPHESIVLESCCWFQPSCVGADTRNSVVKTRAVPCLVLQPMRMPLSLDLTESPARRSRWIALMIKGPQVGALQVRARKCWEPLLAPDIGSKSNAGRYETGEQVCPGWDYVQITVQDLRM